MFFFIYLLLFSFSWGGELETLISYALENSPRIKEYKNIKESFKYREAYSSSLPNPTVFVGFSNLPLNRPYPNSKEPMSSFTVGFSQMYILPIKRELEKRAIAGEREVVLEDENLLKKEIIRDIKVKYLEWFYTLKKEKVLSSIEREVESLESIAKENYRYGNATLSDILSLTGERLKVHKEMEVLKEERDKLKEEINYLVGKNFTLKGEEVHFQEPDFEKVDIEKSPYVKRVRAQLKSLELQMRKRSVEYLPDIELMVEYMARPSMSDMFSVRLGFTLPIWKKNKEDMAVLEKVEEMEAKKQELNDILLNLKKNLNTLRIEYESKKELLKLTDELIKEKRQELEALKLSYKYKKVDFRELLRLYREIWDLEINELDLELATKKILPQLEALL
ncbi:TolC family protein [Hydrogenobacter thermophilus]|uniref:TolC family protein n=1 Tax=Hydrogenobacter thermophilus TaxID=940 RepID=UPI0030F59925